MSTTAPAATLSILTSRSAHVSASECLRRRYWSYEAPNGTATRGWERRRLALPLATGTYVHKGVEAMFNEATVEEAAKWARQEYLKEVTIRGLETEVAGGIEATAVEQAALIEALIYAWARVRLPHLAEEYEVVSVEQEERVTLAPDVVLQTRSDAVLRRRTDAKLFIYNPKTVGDAGERWYRSWETDLQIMTEMLAVEARLGESVAGVLIEGFIKGKRMPEKDFDGKVTGYHQSSPLIYGYKFDGNPPLEPPQYDHAYTRRKGWHRFPAWTDAGLKELAWKAGGIDNGLCYWVEWLPQEVVEAQFAIVPPIWRDQRVTESAIRQIVAQERRIRAWRDQVDATDDKDVALDETFTQNTHACTWPSTCPMTPICWEAGVSDDPQGSGLYIPRRDHHAAQEEA